MGEWGWGNGGWGIEPEACTDVPPAAKGGKRHDKRREDVDRVDVEHRDTDAEVCCLDLGFRVETE
jgi:hypothetical protein